ncbi:MAG: indole-3-glycerol phosphate synthase TrpC [Firmicutes bacterium]|nr:indole-3-glycerol phosphate synthase TrpC [Bacillota bacterium]
MQKNTILHTIAAHAAVRVEAARAVRSLEEVRAAALALSDAPQPFAFEDALRGGDIAFICECKKASPSKGLIAPDFPYLKIAQEYEAAGAACISVLTEPKWFLGEDRYLQEIAGAVTIPCLRKDFVVDEYMLYEARLLHASAALLIVSLLEENTLRRYIKICDELQMSALVEAHDAQEIRTALRAGARIIGVNNRNLKDFSVDFENSRRLRELVPKDILFVAESGVRTADDIRMLREIGADAVLIGETLMRADDKKAMLDALRRIESEA